MLSQLCAAVELGWDVTFMFWTLDQHTLQEESISRAMLEKFGVRVVGPIPQHGQFIRRFITVQKLHYSLEYLYADAKLMSLLVEINHAIAQVGADTKIIAVVVDDNRERMKQDGLNYADIEENEQSILQSADIVACVSSHVCNRMKGFAPQNLSSEMIAMPFTFDYRSQQQTSSVRQNSFRGREGFSFIGHSNPSNRKMLRFLCVVFVGQTSSAFKLNVAGMTYVPDECMNNLNVALHGQVVAAELNSIVQGSRWLLAPCHSDIGISTKIVLAFSLGTPVITTKVCSKGLPADNGIPPPVIELDLNTYGEHSFSLHDDEPAWKALQARTQRYYLDNFSKNTVKNFLQKLPQRGTEKVTLGKPDKHGASTVKENERPSKLLVVWDIHTDTTLSYSILHQLVKQFNFEEFLNMSPEACSQASPDFYVRWVWPVPLNRPECCPIGSCILVVILAWEMGSAPSSWISFINDEVDYVWTLSQQNAKVFNTVPEDRVKVIPLGVTCATSDISHLDSPSLSELKDISANKTVFLYVGGALPRKSIDVIVRAWCQAFKAGDSVVLALKLTYEHGGQDSMSAIQEARLNQDCAEIVLQTGFSTDLSTVYDIADVLVHPARAEGFGLTPLEALSRSLVVIYNQNGATAEFLSNDYAVGVKSRQERCRTWPCEGQQLCVFQDTAKQTWDKCEKLEDFPSWHEPDQTDLAHKMQLVRKHLNEFKERAKLGRKFVCEHFSWKSLSQVYREHLLDAVRLQRQNVTKDLPKQPMILDSEGWKDPVWTSWWTG